jgi:hypothetical protein
VFLSAATLLLIDALVNKALLTNMNTTLFDILTIKIATDPTEQGCNCPFFDRSGQITLYCLFYKSWNKPSTGHW